MAITYDLITVGVGSAVRALAGAMAEHGAAFWSWSVRPDSKIEAGRRAIALGGWRGSHIGSICRNTRPRWRTGTEW